MSLLGGEALNEFDMIKKYIKPQKHDCIVMGQGDDCSVIDWSDGNYFIATTDSLVEDIHFRRSSYSFAELAYKTLAVNISDVAAMGGSPLWAHLSLSLPQTIGEEDIASFFQSFYELAESQSISLVGGDLTASPGPIFVNLHLSGLVKKNKIKWRKGLAQEGVLCVSGPLGSSAAGLYALENGLKDNTWLRFKMAHKKPPIELKKAQWLAGQASVLGMMDLSDGLYSDLQRVAHGGFQIFLEQLPYDPELKLLASKQGLEIWQWLLCGGEDYRILFNCKKEGLQNLQEQYQRQFGENFDVIGISSENPSEPFCKYLLNNKVFDVPWKSYQHFNGQT